MQFERTLAVRLFSCSHFSSEEKEFMRMETELSG